MEKNLTLIKYKNMVCVCVCTNYIGSYSWLDWDIMALILSSSDAFASTRLAV